MKQLRILIVDDCPHVCRMLNENLSLVPEFTVVKTIKDSKLAIDSILEIKPDILLLDVVMPCFDGDEILKQLKDVLTFNLGIIVMSPLSNDITISYYSDLGAHYFIKKPVDLEKLIKNIKQLHMCLNGNLERQLHYGSEVNSNESDSADKTYAMIAKLLIKIGVNPKLKGFCFLKESIYFMSLSGNEMNSVTKIVYPKIAKDYKTEAEKVERAIRTAIEKAFASGNGSKFYYESMGTYRERSSGKKHPSNREFIFTLAEYVKSLDKAEISEWV